MICHASIPAKDPKLAGDVIAKIIDGESMPYPPVRGAYIVVANDESGMAIEFWPDTVTQSPGEGQMISERDPGFDKWDGLRSWDYQLQYDNPPASSTGVHIAVRTKLTVDELKALADSVGWRCVNTDRIAFHLVELWIDNTFLFECITDEQFPRYHSFAKPEVARRGFAMMREH